MRAAHAIAKLLLGFDDKTVGGVRSELEHTPEIPQLIETIGADGKSRPAKKRAEPTKPNKPTPVTTNIVTAGPSTLDQARRLVARLHPDEVEKLLIEAGTRLPRAHRERLVAHLSGVEATAAIMPGAATHSMTTTSLDLVKR